MKLPENFFDKPTVEIAKELLGCYLINGETVGEIVETEAYLEGDPASHSFNGKTKRNFPMFEEFGRAYIYFTYGMHHCFNVVTNKKGVGEAVLIRALKPIKGIGLMKKRRETSKEVNLCNGPAKLVQALGIVPKQNGILLNGKLRIKKVKSNGRIVQTERIGIKKGANLPYRFYIKDSPFVSRKSEKQCATTT